MDLQAPVFSIVTVTAVFALSVLKSLLSGEITLEFYWYGVLNMRTHLWQL